MQLQETLLKRQSCETEGGFIMRGHQMAGLTIIIAFSTNVHTQVLTLDSVLSILCDVHTRSLIAVLNYNLKGEIWLVSQFLSSVL